MIGYRKTGLLVLATIAVVLLQACGGGGGSTATPATPTPPAPTAITGNASLSGAVVTLNGQVNPNGLATTVWFEYGTSETLAAFDNTAEQSQSLAADNTVHDVSTTISGLLFDTTYYYRVVAQNASGVSRGDIQPFATNATGTTANAGPDKFAEEGQEVVLDGTGSSSQLSTIVSYQWERIDTEDVEITLTGADTATARFTIPDLTSHKTLKFRLTVTDGANVTATDNVTVDAFYISFRDDFSDNTIGSYTVTNTLYDLTQTLEWNPAGYLQYTTGNDMGIKLGKDVTAISSGIYSFDFTPVDAFPTHGGFWVWLRTDDPDTYYVIANFSEVSVRDPAGYIAKVVDGVVTDNTSWVPQYSQGETYRIAASFDASKVVLTGFGEEVRTLVLVNDTTPLNVTSFEIEFGQQNGRIDNIRLGE